MIDGQLQEALAAFERTQGVVAPSRARAAARAASSPRRWRRARRSSSARSRLFPSRWRRCSELAATQGKRFAVIADEAHSSQTGEAAAKLKQVLSRRGAGRRWTTAARSARRTCWPRDGGARAATTGITYVAFTATPKAKTLELFGRRPNPTSPPATATCRQPFHVYSMRQAIEEGFILDVLKNYTPYRARLPARAAAARSGTKRRSSATPR